MSYNLFSCVGTQVSHSLSMHGLTRTVKTWPLNFKSVVLELNNHLSYINAGQAVCEHSYFCSYTSSHDCMQNTNTVGEGPGNLNTWSMVRLNYFADFRCNNLFLFSSTATEKLGNLKTCKIYLVLKPGDWGMAVIRKSSSSPNCASFQDDCWLSIFTTVTQQPFGVIALVCFTHPV